MHEKGAAGDGATFPKIVQRFLGVGVGAESLDHLDPRPDWIRLAEDVDRVHAFGEFPAERVLCLEAGEEDDVARLADAMHEVMQHAAAFAHAR